MEKKILFIGFLIAWSVDLNAQTNDVIGKLNNFGVTLEQLEHCLKDADAKFYFKATNTSISRNEDGSDYQTVEISEFDPRREIGYRWKLLSVNGEEPSEKSLKSYNKSTNTNKKEINGQIDQASLKIISEDENKLVITLRFLEKTLPKKYQFLADCDATFVIDKTSKKVVSGSFINFKETNVSIIKVPKLKMDMDFIFLDDAEGYHIKKEQMDMTVRVLGNEASSTAITEYSDFNLVK